MPWFKLIVTRETTESAVAIVEADSMEEAEDKVLDNSKTLEYVGDDWVGDTYITGGDRLEHRP